MVKIFPVPIMTPATSVAIMTFMMRLELSLVQPVERSLRWKKIVKRAFAAVEEVAG